MGQVESSGEQEDAKGHALVSKTAKILVVGGGGTIGSSTALHLARRGYTDIRILDVFQIPSGNSAGNDLNKVAGSGRDGVWGQIGQASWEAWKNDPVFCPHCHPTGRIDVASGPDRKADELYAKYQAMLAEGRGDEFEWLDNEEEIVRRAPHLHGAHIQGWKGLWVRESGWVAARDALDSVGHECRRLGVKTAFGSAGTFKSLLLGTDGKTCTGVKATDDTEWPADLVVLAAGAWSPILVDLEGQCVSKCWVFAHIQLSTEEAQHFKGIPTMYHHELGFFIEPQASTGLLKLCNEFPGYTRMAKCHPFGLNRETVLSVPRSHAQHPNDTMPDEALDEIKRLVKICLPHLVGRPLINQSMCWCTDTPDANWLLCEHPRFPKLILATGDSGHSFNTLPVAGGEVVDMIEGKLSEERRQLWRWRPGYGDPKGTGRPGPAPKDLAHVLGWNHDSPR
ncbi:peroxisomal sarcosine oxidase [Naematelia encephala]|uniref:Peroxisomal sarcosine oxidase n=1 Tax=Naematelia encephala TaxID=71784 RepID=A0A1Y2AMG3_9TREE|nr:peroxisomal sarcosine oxidase [Naematelia encephala]